MMYAAQEFTSAAQLRAHYAATRSRLVGIPRPVLKPKPEPEPVAPAPFLYAPINMLAPCSPEFLIKLVELETGFNRDRLVGKLKTKRVAEARHRAIGLVYQHTQLLLSEVGELFNRDHTSIYHALGRVGVTDKLVEMTRLTAKRNRRGKVGVKHKTAAVVRELASLDMSAADIAKLLDHSHSYILAVGKIYGIQFPHTETALTRAIRAGYAAGHSPSIIAADTGSTPKSVRVIACRLGLTKGMKIRAGFYVPIERMDEYLELRKTMSPAQTAWRMGLDRKAS